MGLRDGTDGVKEWCDALAARFCDAPGKSLTLLESIRYTRDVRNRKDPADYVSAIVLDAKNAGIAPEEPTQVLLAYEHIDGELRRLARSTDSSTVASLLEELRHQKDIWSDIYSKWFEVKLQSTSSRDEGKQPQGQYSNRSNFTPGMSIFRTLSGSTAVDSVTELPLYLIVTRIHTEIGHLFRMLAITTILTINSKLPRFYNVSDRMAINSFRLPVAEKTQTCQLRSPTSRIPEIPETIPLGQHARADSQDALTVPELTRQT